MQATHRQLGIVMVLLKCCSAKKRFRHPLAKMFDCWGSDPDYGRAFALASAGLVDAVRIAWLDSTPLLQGPGSWAATITNCILQERRAPKSDEAIYASDLTEPLQLTWQCLTRVGASSDEAFHCLTSNLVDNSERFCRETDGEAIGKVSTDLALAVEYQRQRWPERSEHLAALEVRAAQVFGALLQVVPHPAIQLAWRLIADPKSLELEHLDN